MYEETVGDGEKVERSEAECREGEEECDGEEVSWHGGVV